FLRVGTVAEIPEGEAAFGKIRGSLAGQAEIEPVLAVKGGCRPLQQLRPFTLQPEELARLVGRIEARAGVKKDLLADTAFAQRPHDGGRARIVPQQGLTQWLPRLVDQPGSVALPRHCQSEGSLRQVRQLLHQGAQHGGAVLPGGPGILLHTAVGEVVDLVAEPRGGQLLALGREGHRLQHRGTGVEADQEVAAHTPPPAGCRPWARALPLSLSKRWRHAGGKPRVTSLSRGRSRLRSVTTKSRQSSTRTPRWLWSPSHWLEMSLPFRRGISPSRAPTTIRCGRKPRCRARPSRSSRSSDWASGARGGSSRRKASCPASFSTARPILPSARKRRAGKRFIAGSPMKEATKRFAGRFLSSAGVPNCCRTPCSITATRSASATASFWSWVTKTVVKERSIRNSLMRVRRTARSCGSNCDMGSSSRCTAARRTRARARLTRCCWPAEMFGG